MVPSGHTTTFHGDNCTMGTVNGVIYSNAAVPAGKILVIEAASAACGKNVLNAFAAVQFHPANGLGRRVFSLSLQSTQNSVQSYAGTSNGRMYIKGTNIRVTSCWRTQPP